jgi:anaerobic selenocysteine-containing dehydrogenase
LRTADKQIDLAPEVFIKDLVRVKAKWDYRTSLPSSSSAPFPPQPPNGHFLLIGRRELRSNNSWLHNTERLLRGEPRCTMLMHPSDAANRDLRDGQTVSVRSRVGTIELPLEITDEIMPGVVSIPHGWGHDRDGIQLDVARAHAGTSINDITDHHAIDALCGTAAFNGTRVEVEAVRE